MSRHHSRLRNGISFGLQLPTISSSWRIEYGNGRHPFTHRPIEVHMLSSGQTVCLLVRSPPPCRVALFYSFFSISTPFLCPCVSAPFFLFFLSFLCSLVLSCHFVALRCVALRGVVLCLVLSCLLMSCVVLCCVVLNLKGRHLVRDICVPSRDAPHQHLWFVGFMLIGPPTFIATLTLTLTNNPNPNKQP